MHSIELMYEGKKTISDGAFYHCIISKKQHKM